MAECNDIDRLKLVLQEVREQGYVANLPNGDIGLPAAAWGMVLEVTIPSADTQESMTTVHALADIARRCGSRLKDQAYAAVFAALRDLDAHTFGPDGLWVQKTKGMAVADALEEALKLLPRQA
ncbi:hypothetical protein [Sphingosinicella sp. BN140058]|uniref:hypothetical protein n=1 Tax=Sphingosinicella sp. BN140058 TaxID=1892855 RepID=UPI0010102265|nr:hypothetical protein [Sphingosinicella sp. BN140058]QAY80358.1 hypothetical protein ETR14_27335 [Sphingosinicella sp. BN140058]